MGWDKSQAIATFVGVGLTLLGAIIGGVGSGAWYMAKFDDRLEQIDGNLVNIANRVIALEAQDRTSDRTPDPLAQTCADLAQRIASASEGSDMAKGLEAAMINGGCNTPRK